MFHFGSLVPAPVQLGKHSCDIPSQFQSLGRLYVPLPFTCSGSVSPWGTFPLRPRVQNPLGPQHTVWSSWITEEAYRQDTMATGTCFGNFHESLLLTLCVTRRSASTVSGRSILI